jgi:arylsulfatase A-like enzyme
VPFVQFDPMSSVHMLMPMLRPLLVTIFTTLMMIIVRLDAMGQTTTPASQAHKPDTERKPNIIMILADDMGWADAACYGHPYAKTPSIDRLALDGTRFTCAYAAGVTCSPSRTALMTSRWPARYEKYPADAGFGDRVTITELLNRAGYVTGHFGKWHIGPKPSPGTYGIDVISDAEPRRARRADDPLRGRDTPVFDAAIEFIEANKGMPFYMNVWCHTPHHPVNPSPELLEAFGPLTLDESRFPPEMQLKFESCRKQGGDVGTHMRAYLAELAGMDAQIGRLLARLDELGLTQDTIVVFSSDQGPAPIRDHAEESALDRSERRRERGKDAAPEGSNAAALRLNAMGFAGPLRAGKHSQYEGGVRVPFIVRWPGRVPANRVDESAVISLADWLPTLCAITGIEIKALEFDGEDMSAKWFNSNAADRSRPLLWKTSAPRSPATVREGRWKLHEPNNRREQVELYDINADRGETRNVAAEHPDVVQHLSALVAQWQARLPKAYEKGREDED